MKDIILFLDHDGVICTDREWGKRSEMNTKFDPLNMMAVARLNTVHKDINFKIVCTSDWRLMADIEEMRVIYKTNGIVADLIDYTEKLDPTRFSEKATDTRAREILKYVDENSIQSWFVIDDMYLPKLPKKNYYRTNLYDGLTQSDVPKIIEKMRKL
jgi:hypothetical protein